ALRGRFAETLNRLAVGLRGLYRAGSVAALVAPDAPAGGAPRRSLPRHVRLADSPGPSGNRRFVGRLASRAVAGGLETGTSGGRLGVPARPGTRARGFGAVPGHREFHAAFVPHAWTGGRALRLAGAGARPLAAKPVVADGSGPAAGRHRARH